MLTLETRVDVGDVTLAVTEAGPKDGPPVLLLHGFPDSRRLWRHQLVALAAAGHRVLAPDLRGFGDSDRPAQVEAYAMEHLVADVSGLLDAMGVQSAAVVGHDWGAVLAWAYAMAEPQRVDKLVAVSVGHPGARRGAGVAQLVKGAYIPVFLVPGLAERLLPAAGWFMLRHVGWSGADADSNLDVARQVNDLSRPGALPAALSWYRANIGPPRARRPGRSALVRARRHVTCPVMGVWSSRDPALTEAQMTGSAAFVDGPWRYERLDGVGHWIPVEAPEELSALLVDFLA